MKEIIPRGTVVGVPGHRKEVIELLNEAYASDLIEIEEYEERVEEAEKARSLEALDELIKDLPASLSTDTTLPGADAPQKYKLIMGSKRLAGNWLHSRQVEVKTVMGSMEIDLRKVELPPGVTELKLKTVMGSVEVVVPPGLTVHNDTKEIMSSVELDDLLDRVKKTGSSVLRISGSVIMGSLDIKVK